MILIYIKVETTFCYQITTPLSTPTTPHSPHGNCQLSTVNLLLHCCSVAVLERHVPPLKILLYLYYINIELIFDYRITYFGTATLQQLQHTSCLTDFYEYSLLSTQKYDLMLITGKLFVTLYCKVNSKARPCVSTK